MARLPDLGSFFEAVVRRRRGQGPFEAFGTFPNLIRRFLTTIRALIDDVGEQQLAEAESELGLDEAFLVSLLPPE